MRPGLEDFQSFLSKLRFHSATAGSANRVRISIAPYLYNRIDIPIFIADKLRSFRQRVIDRGAYYKPFNTDMIIPSDYIRTYR